MEKIFRKSFMNYQYYYICLESSNLLGLSFIIFILNLMLTFNFLTYGLQSTLYLIKQNQTISPFCSVFPTEVSIQIFSCDSDLTTSIVHP